MAGLNPMKLVSNECETYQSGLKYGKHSTYLNEIKKTICL